VISIGGSVIASEKTNVSFLKKLSKLLNELSKEYKIFLVVGGGDIARKYINIGREFGLDEKSLDSIGIASTRANALFFAMLLKDSNKNDIPHSTDRAIELGRKYKIVVMGGTTPGHSTDMVGAELAEKAEADMFIIATNVDGIYNKDPNLYSDAKKFDEIDIDKLINLVGGTEWKSAGKKVVIDGPACEIIKRGKIKTFVINGKKIEVLETLIRENKLKEGTKINIR
jgi:uridylate kinase